MLSSMTDEWKSFFDLLKKAISPPSPIASGTSELAKNADYTDTKTRPHSSEDADEKPSDTSHESNA